MPNISAIEWLHRVSARWRLRLAAESSRAEASKTLRHMDWFEVVQERGRIVGGKVDEFQVALKVGFKIER